MKTDRDVLELINLMEMLTVSTRFNLSFRGKLIMLLRLVYLHHEIAILFIKKRWRKILNIIKEVFFISRQEKNFFIFYKWKFCKFNFMNDWAVLTLTFFRYSIGFNYTKDKCKLSLYNDGCVAIKSIFFNFRIIANHTNSSQVM